jgi:hypothetical protein
MSFIDYTETRKLKLTYSFYKGSTKLAAYSPEDIFFLGREVTPRPKITKVEKNIIRYYLQDNGGDRRIKDENGTILSTNELIEKRKNRENYFNLSRKPKDSRDAQE